MTREVFPILETRTLKKTSANSAMKVNGRSDVHGLQHGNSSEDS